MSYRTDMTLAEIETLSPEAQMEIVVRLWDRIAEQNPGPPLSDREKALLDERYRKYKDHPGRSWNEVKADIKSKKPE